MDLEGGNQVSDPAVNQLEAEVVTLTEETSAGMDVAEEKLLENSAGTENHEDDIAASDISKEDAESHNSSKEWQEIEDQAEPPSFDCTECPAVLPTPELLKMHMVTHQK